ncbi:hypothetical protein OC835_005750 [Tilletia horrida]|nr:hypothetical protein OC835_005750 [Tilletia horrida]
MDHQLPTKGGFRECRLSSCNYTRNGDVKRWTSHFIGHLHQEDRAKHYPRKRTTAHLDRERDCNAQTCLWADCEEFNDEHKNPTSWVDHIVAHAVATKPLRFECPKCQTVLTDRYNVAVHARSHLEPSLHKQCDSDVLQLHARSTTKQGKWANPEYKANAARSEYQRRENMTADRYEEHLITQNSSRRLKTAFTKWAGEQLHEEALADSRR